MSNAEEIHECIVDYIKLVQMCIIIALMNVYYHYHNECALS